MLLLVTVTISFLSERSITDIARVWVHSQVRPQMSRHTRNLGKTLLAKSAHKFVVKAPCGLIERPVAVPQLVFADSRGASGLLSRLIC